MYVHICYTLYLWVFIHKILISIRQCSQKYAPILCVQKFLYTVRNGVCIFLVKSQCCHEKRPGTSTGHSKINTYAACILMMLS